MQKVKTQWTSPEGMIISSGAFGDVSAMTLEVPLGCTDNYKVLSPWNEFKEIVEYDDPTAILQANADCGVTVSTSAHSIHLSGTVAGDSIKVYSTAGALLQSITAGEGVTTVSGLMSGEVYIVKIGKKSVKVAL